MSYLLKTNMPLNLMHTALLKDLKFKQMFTGSCSAPLVLLLGRTVTESMVHGRAGVNLYSGLGRTVTDSFVRGKSRWSTG